VTEMDSFLAVVGVAATYGAGCGSCRIYETDRHVVFEFYNAGFSPNECDDAGLRQVAKPFLDDHPITLYVFGKANLPDNVLERVRGDVDYKRLNAYRYVIDID
jgi:hypothetical protein